MRSRFLAFALIVVAAGTTGAFAAEDRADPYADERASMVETLKKHAAGTSVLDGSGFESSVLEAMAATPRHEFVPEEVRDEAYADRPLPIGYGQTISQPFIVALMTDLLDVDEDDKVLEIGTGSAYHAAVLSPLTDHVYSIEIVPELGNRAAETLDRLAYDNVVTKVADGYYGWPEHGPFDAIVVTAAASHIPSSLIEQLKPGGRIVIPVGSAFFNQQLMLVEKKDGGGITTRQLLPVRFVPLTGENA